LILLAFVPVGVATGFNGVLAYNEKVEDEKESDEEEEGREKVERCSPIFSSSIFKSRPAGPLWAEAALLL
jgi:hypothetical protein